MPDSGDEGVDERQILHYTDNLLPPQNSLLNDNFKIEKSHYHPQI